MKFFAICLALLSAAILSESFIIVKRDTKDDLKKSMDELKEEAKKEIAKLIAEGKQGLAKGLEAAEKRVEDIEAQLEKLNPTTDAGKALLKVLEGLAKEAEQALKDELKKLSGKYYEDDIKTTLLALIAKLKEAAEAAIAKLTAEGKGVLAKGIEEAEKVVLDIEAQVKALNPNTEVGKLLLNGLEALLKAAESKLEEEIKKLTGKYYDATDDLKNTLLIEGEKLKKLAEEEIAKLKKEGKAELAKGLEAIEKRILDIETQLKALNPTTEVGKALLSGLEALLKKAEDALTAELKKLSGKYYENDIKTTLLALIAKLKEAAEAAIAKLKAEGKGALAKGIEEAEKVVLDIEAQVQKVNPNTEVGKAVLTGLEALLKAAESKLEEEIKKLTGKYYEDDLKTTLLALIAKLKESAEAAIAKLKAEGKGALAKGIEEAEKVVLDIEAQVKALNPNTEVGKLLLTSLEALLKAAESKLEEEIKKLTGKYYDATDDLKNTLLIEGEKLKKLAEKEIAKLKKEGKAELAKGLEAIEKTIVDIETQLKALNPKSEVGKALLSGLEALLKKAEDALTAELKKLSGKL